MFDAKKCTHSSHCRRECPLGGPMCWRRAGWLLFLKVGALWSALAHNCLPLHGDREGYWGGDALCAAPARMRVQPGRKHRSIAAQNERARNPARVSKRTEIHAGLDAAKRAVLTVLLQRVESREGGPLHVLCLQVNLGVGLFSRFQLGHRRRQPLRLLYIWSCDSWQPCCPSTCRTCSCRSCCCCRRL